MLKVTICSKDGSESREVDFEPGKTTAAQAVEAAGFSLGLAELLRKGDSALLEPEDPLIDSDEGCAFEIVDGSACWGHPPD